MSEVEKTQNMRRASGAGWTEREKIAYLIVLCENEGRLDTRISNAPIPAGRSVIACQKLLVRLKKTFKEDIERIKNGQPLGADTSDETATLSKTPETPKTVRKRKSKAGDEDADGSEEGVPMKKQATSQTRKSAGAVEEVVKKEI